LKKVSAIALLAILVFNLVGVFFVFKIQQYHARKEMKQLIKQGLPESSLIAISFSYNETNFEWKDEHEFRYKGIMYDIVKQTSDGSTITYFCVNDEQESALFAHLDEELQKNESGKKTNNCIKLLFKFLAGMNCASADLLADPSVSPVVLHNHFMCIYSHPAKDIQCPPPELV
jgi:hypothetical protein